jgi:hypothetical protein
VKQLLALPSLPMLLDEEADNSSAKLLPHKKRICLRIIEKKMEDKVDEHENPRNKQKYVHSWKLAAPVFQEKCRFPDGSSIGWGRLKKRRFRISRPSCSSWGQFLDKKKEIRKVVTPLRSSAREDCTARNSAMNPAAASQDQNGSLTQVADRPSLDSLLDEEVNNKKKMEDKVDERSGGEHENPRNYEPNESFTQRVLTDVDTEIGLLNGIVDYYTRNIGIYPFYDFVALNDFIKNWLQVDIRVEQLIVLVGKLRKKYYRTLARMGATLDIADPRHQIAFNLANKIWGAESKDEYWKV